MTHACGVAYNFQLLWMQITGVKVSRRYNIVNKEHDVCYVQYIMDNYASKNAEKEIEKKNLETLPHRKP